MLNPKSAAPTDQDYFGAFYFCNLALFKSSWHDSAETSCSTVLFLEKSPKPLKRLKPLYIQSSSDLHLQGSSAHTDEEDVYQKINIIFNVFLGNEVSVEATSGKQVQWKMFALASLSKRE